MHVVAHGNYVDAYAVDLTPPPPARPWASQAAGTVFAFVGAIRGYKGVGELLEAFSASPELGPDARLLICGKPLPKRSARELEARPRRTRASSLRLERIPEEELSPIIRAADARRAAVPGHPHLRQRHPGAEPRPAGHRAGLGCLPETLPPDATFLYDAEAPGRAGRGAGRSVARRPGSHGRARTRATRTRSTGRHRR